ncbi:MAG: DUF499 domain-containing protein [Selenomonadaceae bacterium]|nr:DUF499 domain-containing protein [Selenomonadaceae bacterium]
MNEKNHAVIGRAMNFVLRPMLAAFVQKKLARHFGTDSWWRLGVLDVLYPEQKRFLPQSGTYEELTDALDMQLCILLIDIHWREIFSVGLSRNYFHYVKELKGIRNAWAHEPESFDDAATARALDTMALISEQFDADTTEQLRAMWKAKLNRQSEPAAVVNQREEIFTVPGNLKSWRDVIEPNPDVAHGRYKQAEFAADLAQVVRGEGSPEYVNPVEFFSRTYLTGGLKTLLVETLRRLTSGNGEPVIQLKTSFGGGKTHSLLALYHLFSGKIRAEQSSAVREILNAAQVEFLPKVHTAIIVGTWTNPLKSTLWGEIGAQLARSTGKPELYELIRENDEKKTAPGVETLREIFNAASPCLILIDEVVAYGRKLKKGEVDGGTFGNLLSFIQELTESAKASSKTAVVVSIPESDAEVGDELGRQVLKQVEHYFGRIEFVWESATPVEGYEIVRRRLFKDCKDTQAREETCSAFFSMYVNNANDFPNESRQNNYREKLLACYPIHPKLFDYLYDKWTSLEGFQKTRGVLRLMANVIHCLWSQNDQSALIMPGNVPLDFAPVRTELAKYFKGNWDAIINSEVDGENSKPYELDGNNPRFGRLCAARKISRTIFMGTAPSSRAKDLRGIEENEIRLGTIQPQDLESVAVFNDALTKLKANLYYLYSQNTRLWFGVNPTLRKLVDDKREQFSDDDVDYEIEQRLRTWRKTPNLAVHLCPKTSADVADEQSARLVILAPKYAFDDKQAINPALAFAETILNTRGTIPRKYKNTLLFLAAESNKLSVLRKVVREFKAWSEVISEADQLNLDRVQHVDAQSNLKSEEKNFDMKLSQAYCQLFAPDNFGETNMTVLKWFFAEIDCTTADNIAVGANKLASDEMLLHSLGHEKLKNLLDKFIWRERDAVQLSRLWEYFTTYYYMPRLTDRSVLLETVRKGVAEKTFALSDDKEFHELRFGDISLREISTESFLVKSFIAQKLLDKKSIPKELDKIQPNPVEPDSTSTKSTKSKKETKQLSKHFSMDVELDKTRLSKSFNACIDEVASYLMHLPNVSVSIRLDIDISAPEGIPEDLKEVISENCHTLKIKNFYFEN